jgi:diguanylate cyclase (GGDEF)-like protein
MQDADSSLTGQVQALVARLAQLVARLPGAQPSDPAAPPSAISLEPPNEQFGQLLRLAEQRALSAEAQLVKLQRRIENETRQNQDSAQELNRLAFQDPLTGLANANLMLEHVEKALRGISARQRLLVLVVDLDHFSVVNQMLGHEHGDELLIRVSERLHALASEFQGAVGRFAEDEFVLTLNVATGEAEARAGEFAQAVRSRLSPPFLLQGQKVPLTVSQGGALASGMESSGRDLLQQARTALAHAKRSGRNQYHLYNPEFERQLRRESTLEFQLGYALEEGELFLCYQPIIWQDELTDGAVQGRLIGVEALLRWRHRTEGVLCAKDFLESAERSGRMVAIGRQMFEKACADFARWRAAGADLYLNFNLSARELLEPDIATAMSETVDRFELPRERVTFEFSETTPMIDRGLAYERLMALRSKGFVLAIDHFGAGVSTLRRLSTVQFIKLSPRLLEGDRYLVDKALSLARGLGLLTVGAGVETAEAARFLLARGCPTVQGFYFSQPLDAEGVLELYRSQPSWKL